MKYRPITIIGGLYILFISFSTKGYCYNNLNKGKPEKFKNRYEGNTLFSDTSIEGEKESSIIANKAKPILLSKQLSFTEGPAVDKKGNIYFTDQPNDKIWKYGTDGKLSVFLDKTGRSNGLYIDKEGNIIACADEKNELWSITPEKKVTVLMKGYKGKRLNGPNDLWVNAKGDIYFTDPYYQRPYWDRKKPDIEGEKVYYLPKGKTEPVIVDETLLQPNGIVGTPDGRYLYVADIKDNKTYKFEINKDGTISNRTLFVEQGSDGMTLDNKGNVYLAGNGITVYNKEGKKIEHIDIPEPWTANLCFGGKNKDQLFITASKAIYLLNMKVKGVE